MTQEYIVPGSLAWEDICRQCGLCCLIKVADRFGRIWLTDVRCDMLDPETRKCKCYSENSTARDTSVQASVKDNCCFLNHKNLRNDYIVPACCSYVQYFCGESSRVKKFAERPDIDWSKTVPESSVPESELGKHLLPGTCRYFKYNPAVNKAYREKNKSR